MVVRAVRVQAASAPSACRALVEQVLPTPDYLTVLCRSCIAAPICPRLRPPVIAAAQQPPPPARRPALASRRAQVHGDVLGLHQHGVRVGHIARDLALSRNTVRRWVRGKQPELHRPRMHSLDTWRTMLERCPVSFADISPRDRCTMAEGCQRFPALAGPARCRVERRHARCHRVGQPAAGGGSRAPVQASAGFGHAALSRPAAYPSRRVARMLTADLPSLADPDRAYVERLLRLSPALAVSRDLALRFGIPVRARSADALTPWLADAKNSRNVCPASTDGSVRQAEPETAR